MKSNHLPTIFDRIAEEQDSILRCNQVVLRKTESFSEKSHLPVSEIRYQAADSLFGPILIAATHEGICHLSFFEDRWAAFQVLQTSFPAQTFVEGEHPLMSAAIAVLQNGDFGTEPIILQIKGSLFQFAVWEKLLQIPFGQLTTYQHIAHLLGNVKASRAVGSAVGSNPVAFFIPCHRVVQTSGKAGGYKWGLEQKMKLIRWEQNHYCPIKTLRIKRI